MVKHGVTVAYLIPVRLTIGYFKLIKHISTKMLHHTSKLSYLTYIIPYDLCSLWSYDAEVRWIYLENMGKSTKQTLGRTGRMAEYDHVT